MIGFQTAIPLLILLPMMAAGLCRILSKSILRNLLILISCTLMVIGVFGLLLHPPVMVNLGEAGTEILNHIITCLDFLLLSLFMYFGWRNQSRKVILLSALQFIFLLYFEILAGKDGVSNAAIINCDGLSLLMLLVVSGVGTFICIHAIPYMANHERHLNLEKSRQSAFFAVVMLFLGSMNALVLSNQLHHVYFWFEVTTLCSFLLIGHDRTPEATRNAVRALWMNSIGGLAFLLALILVHRSIGSLDIRQILSIRGGEAPFFLFGVALLCLACFTKSAQFPFQSWLLGAMVAPTPVSALLHSSTMVNVGVYLVLRLSPAMRGTFLSDCVVVCGAFGFLAAATLAVGQSNGKKVLAYSTISNLGLIFACAGINTPMALTAAVYLLLFHAITKALLFLCVGTIEQHIESRDIEDMRGLYGEMPITALITVAGVIMMIMPPFGVLLGKWMAMESAAHNLYAIILIVPGSALTVMYWARWAGALMSDPFAGQYKAEKLPLFTWTGLVALCGLSAGISVAAPWIYTLLIQAALPIQAAPAYQTHFGILENSIGGFAIFPLSLVALMGCLISVWALRWAGSGRIVSPYLCGLQTDKPCVFTGPMNRPTRATAGNYYLSSLFGEATLNTWVNAVAMVLLVLMLGGAR